ncbi:MAG TPA: type IV-A pilus assembly ATPase PilB [Thermoanaerobaculia bacterium]|nr:type IV-A pilus assembly ATPase PilB [Thermoanaerobaculia bacterium]HSN88874.1 type IV-A pilus assembly ATPase PilB [Thermoanaerobaculia bacterium]
MAPPAEPVRRPQPQIPDKLGELLIKAGRVTQAQLNEALALQKDSGGRVGTNLVKLGHMTERQLVDALSQHFRVPSVDLAAMEIDESVLKIIPADLARKYTILPVGKMGATITVAMIDPTNVFAMDDVKFMTGYKVEPVVASETAIRMAIDRYYGSAHAIELKKVMENLTEEAAGDLEVLDEEEDLDLSTLEEESEQAPVVKLVNIILTDAIKRGASDIHIEPYEKDYRVRYRIDGILYETMRPPVKLREAITSRVKIMARLDIAEKRLPQDGRIKIKAKIEGKSKDLDYRVSVLPTLFGEKIVMRLLDKDKLMLDMTKLGFEAESLRKFEAAIMKPYGMVLVTGPTGSGKTNTLYSALQRINTTEVNIITAEDPVEFNLAGINQVQMREQIGLNFAAALRSFLRQDPNIVLVGEIRDFETAEVAIKAAMTGHLVLSTLHTNDAPSSISRLMNMGIEPFLVATSVHLIVAQRLVRRICSFCKEPFDMPPQALIEVGFSEAEARTLKLFKGRGCDRCTQTGYKGRVGLYEVLEIDDELRELVLSGGSAYELRQKAIQNGLVTLRGSGLQKIRDGMTSVEEVVRETVL